MDEVRNKLIEIMNLLDEVLDNDEIPSDLWDLLNSSFHNVDIVFDSLDNE